MAHRTLADLIADSDAAFAAARRRRATARTEAERLLERTKAEHRERLTLEEDERFTRLRAQAEAAAAEIARLAEQRKRLDEIVAEEQENTRMSNEITATAAASTAAAAKPAYDGVVRVGAEARTYRPDGPGGDPTGRGFLLDVSRAFLFGDVAANQRLGRHMDEERVERGGQLVRAVGTGAYAGLVVPQYLTDMFAPATAALRPFADVCSRHDLPAEGMSVNISRITTATGVAVQAAENAAVQETNMDDTLLTESVQTFAGQQTISRQAIERGTGVEDVTVQDLFRRYATALDSVLINQATTGALATAQATAYTDTDPTAAELWPFIFQAQSKLEAALLGQAVPDYVIMHSRRWNWLCSQVGTSFPFIGAGGEVAARPGGVIVTNEHGAGVRGILSNGLRVIVDNNLPTNLGTGTNEDVILLVASGECHLWEDPQAPMLIRAEQPAASSLGVLLVVYGYASYTFRRYGNNPGKITGTGLVAPAGF